MKKRARLVVSAALLFSVLLGLVACGKKDSGSTVENSTSSSPPATSVSDALPSPSETVPVTAVRLNADTLTMGIGDEIPLTATVIPENATNRGLIWMSSNKPVATVDDSGKVHALSAGKSKITVKSVDGGFTASCQITVSKGTVTVIGVVLNKSALQMKVGESKKLTATVLPTDAVNKEVTWKSSDASIVKVEKGTVVGVKEGFATVTVTTEEGGNTASCLVSVIGNNDPMDQIDLSAAKKIEDLGGYNGGLRLKSSGEILFSPNLNEFRQLVVNDSCLQNFGW